jgi:glycine hydroxymethyltransferase
MTKESISQIIAAENRKANTLLHLTANENRMSAFVQDVLKSPLSFRYSLGTLNDFSDRRIINKPNIILRGMGSLYCLEREASNILNRRLGGVYTDFRPLSGVHAMICTISSLSIAGDVIVSLNPSAGGHFATANIVNSMGRKSVLLGYDETSLAFDPGELREIARQHKVKVMFIDDSLALYPPNIMLMREILGKETVIVYDASHTLGLILGGHFMDPIREGCNIVQGNTHKTFPGPQKALIHFDDESLAAAVCHEVGSKFVSSQHTHHSLAVHLTLMEIDVYGDSYAVQIVANSTSLANALTKKGFSLLSNGKEFAKCHQIFIEIPTHKTAFSLFEALLDCGISVNVKTVFGKEFIRIGTQEATRLGMEEAEMLLIAEIFDLVLNRGNLQEAVHLTDKLVGTFKKIRYSFDEQD